VGANFEVIAAATLLVVVFLLPLLSHRVESNLEIFLFVMGVLAAASAGVLNQPLIRDAVSHPIPITLAVLVAGLLFKAFRDQIDDAVVRLRLVLPMKAVVAILIVTLGLLSSIVTAIIASLILVEVISAMNFRRQDETRIVVIACMAIGLGAALTPIGEPLATIATGKLRADFWFLLRLLGPWIVPAILAVGVWGALQPLRYEGETLAGATQLETYRGVIERTARVYIFVAGLTLLGAGFEPIVNRYIVPLDPRILYWVNTLSAVLDNATLAAAEVSPRMNTDQLRGVLIALLISGGALIPGNIPNIIAAGRLRIGSREWARTGVPLALVMLAVYYVLLFGR
jgi:predicted cation transporter